ncbi:MAG: hypothetical protein IT204_09815 [Fimbriimonadaceae bacterium]|nr:hypothetical protein [Fimbriimonadaceae bacterium]
MQLAVREVYMPAHFGNSWECFGRREMREYLAESAWWGFNRYSDWFDTIDLSDPYAQRQHYQMAHALWDRKRAAFQAAQAAGLECGLVITPNHVCVDQVSPQTVAEKAHPEVFGQLVCPSKPGVRELILRLYEHLFADLAACGVRLRAISPCPYDYGGCTCARCQPWILTFAALCRDLLALARRRHPECELHPVGWWWKEAEHDQFADWCDREMPGAVASIALHIPYGQRQPPQRMLPSNSRLRAFVHNGYADAAEPRDVYGKWGPVIAPTRLPATLQALAERGASGFMAYSEGAYEDVNRAILAALSSGRASDVPAVLREYARRYFGASAAAASEWAEWLPAWAEPWRADPTTLRPVFEGLAKAAPDSWRLAQWRCKLRLFELHHVIGDGPGWSAARRALAAEWLDVTEELQRWVWRLGPQRHIFGEKFLMPGWFGSYRQAVGLPGETGAVGREV